MARQGGKTKNFRGRGDGENKDFLKKLRKLPKKYLLQVGTEIFGRGEGEGIIIYKDPEREVVFWTFRCMCECRFHIFVGVDCLGTPLLEYQIRALWLNVDFSPFKLPLKENVPPQFQVWWCGREFFFFPLLHECCKTFFTPEIQKYSHPGTGWG